MSRKSHCINPSSGQVVANSALGSNRLATSVMQHKQPVDNTFFGGLKQLSSTAQDLNSEMKYVKRSLMLNGYNKWMIQNTNKKQHTGSPEFIPKLVYRTQLTWERFGETLYTNCFQTCN